VATPSGQIKVSRYLLVLVIALIGLYALVFLTGDKKPNPKLGLDLRGGTSMTLTAVNQAGGQAPSQENLNTARQIIENRVNASGVTEAEVVIEGKQNIVVNVAKGMDEGQLRKLVQPAQLNFREVLAQGQDHPVAPAEPSASASASAAPSGSASASVKSSPSASTKPSGSPSASASQSGPASPSASTNPSAAAAAKKLDEVQKKLGAAWTFAGQYLQQLQSMSQQGQDPSQLLQQPGVLEGLAPFGRLDPNDVAVLPEAYQFAIPTVTCQQLNNRDPGAIADPKAQVVACDQGEDVHTKYFLDKTGVPGTEVRGASSGYEIQNGGWYTGLQFTSAGGSHFTALTQSISNKATQDQQTHYMAIVLDNEAVSVASVTKPIVGDAIISGSGINQDSAKLLETQLKYGSLPLTFKIESVSSVSATLGKQQLGYGLLAGGIGIVLVIGYCLFYYRALGLVVIASLAVSAALVFASLVLLGRIMGFTLSLAGIAGFIVAIGITADSFVVFFERLKDEVKEGRTVRSAVPRAWVRARRTILSADAVSFLAAAILYWLAAGAVKGFAFTLGLSTILDLLIVFLFTHPLVALLSRSNGFTSPRVSGLGNVRSDRAAEAAAATGRFGTMRTKES
jgi:preprotein translocase subunit SecD